jgi:crotonobetainyl-CoA:carnitine CoA-transferase CaiB-like acyl-CoA transferase
LGPLDGLLVVDLSERSVASAIAGMLLADYGAEVVRVEPPGGDPLRALQGTRIWFRGQSSVTAGEGGLDEDELERLCRSADVVIDTARAWTEKSFTYGPPFPEHQVYCLLTAEPAQVEDVVAGLRPAEHVYGELAEARYGFVYVQEGVRREPPIFLGLPHAAVGAAWLIELGVLSAYYHRLRTGRGQVVTTSLADALAIMNNWRWVGGGDPPVDVWPPYSSWDRFGNSRFILGLFECADGWLQVNVGARGAANKFFKLIDREDLVDPRTDVDIYNPMPQDVADELWEYMRVVFRTKTVSEWFEQLSAADVSVMPVLQPGEAFGMDEVQVQGLTQEAHGSLQYGLAAKFERTPGSVGTPATPPGEANERYRASLDRRRTDRPAPANGRSADGRGPLADVVVVDVGLFVAGPLAMRLLADLGAKVIKIDDPNFVGQPMPGHTLAWNHGKQSIAINLKSEEGRALVRELVQRADVFDHNQRFGVMDRLGLSARDLRAANPRLVYCHSSGYGNDGPWATLPVFGPLPDALAGSFTRTAGAGNRPLHYVSHVDFGNALNAAPLVLAALIERERSGQGQFMETVQLGASLLWTSDCFFEGDQLVQTFELDSFQRGHAPTNALYRTADGWVVLACYSEREWSAAHAALDAEQRETYAAARRRTIAPEDDESALAKALAALETGDALRRLAEAGVGCAEPDPQYIVPELLMATDLERIGPIKTYTYPTVGEVFEVGRPVRFSDAPVDPSTRSPHYGEDTRAILEELGLSPDEVERLLDAGVVVEHDVQATRAGIQA